MDLIPSRSIYEVLLRTSHSIEIYVCHGVALNHCDVILRP